jgi:hypothetical protein
MPKAPLHPRVKTVTATTTDDGFTDIYLCNGTFTLTLAVGTSRRRVDVVNIGTGTVTVASASGSVLGVASLAGQYTAAGYVWDGTNWYARATTPGANAFLLNTVTATAAEITRTCDVSARVVAAGATLSVTEALHDGKVIALDTAAGSVVTLPAATGSGARFRFVITVIATSNSHKIQVANASDTMTGMIVSVSDDAGFPVKGYTADATAGADTITLNRSTTGSTVKGEWVEVIDIAANKWAVSGQIAATGTEATPFSAAV